jgi:hypothetical protein
MTLTHAAAGHVFRREAQVAKKLAEALALTSEHGFDSWKALCAIHLGSALLQSGEQVSGIANIEEGLKGSEAAGMFTSG